MIDRGLNWPLYQSLFVDVPEQNAATDLLGNVDNELAAIRTLFAKGLVPGTFYDGLLQEVRRELGLRTAMDELSSWCVEESSSLYLRVMHVSQAQGKPIDAVIRPARGGVEFCSSADGLVRWDEVDRNFEQCAKGVFERLMAPLMALEISQEDWTRSMRSDAQLRFLARLIKAKKAKVYFSNPGLRRKFLWAAWVPKLFQR